MELMDVPTSDSPMAHPGKDRFPRKYSSVLLLRLAKYRPIQVIQPKYRTITETSHLLIVYPRHVVYAHGLGLRASLRLMGCRATVSASLSGRASIQTHAARLRSWARQPGEE